MSAPERNGQEEEKLSTTAAVNGFGAVETVAENSTDLHDIETIGKWTCGKNEDDSSMCLTEVYSGTLATLMIDEPTSKVAEVSDRFLDAWK